MNTLEVFGAVFIGLVGFGCTLGLLASVCGWLWEQRERDRLEREFEQFLDLEVAYHLPAVKGRVR